PRYRQLPDSRTRGTGAEFALNTDHAAASITHCGWCRPARAGRSRRAKAQRSTGGKCQGRMLRGAANSSAIFHGGSRSVDAIIVLVARRRYVARGVPGGYRIWDNRARKWWGERYELCPDELLDELNAGADYARVTALLKRYRSLKR